MYNEVRFHGISGMRDRGGFADSISADATLPELRLEKQKLIAQQSELHLRLAPLVDKVKSGATEAELTLIGELNAEARVLNTKLAHVQAVLSVAEEQQERTEAANRRAKFDELVGRAPALRAEFAHKFKDLCLLLGRLCSDVDSCTEIGNQLAMSSVCGLLPVDRHALQEMSAAIDPLSRLLDEFSPTDKFGWNLRIAVVPLKGK